MDVLQIMFSVKPSFKIEMYYKFSNRGIDIEQIQDFQMFHDRNPSTIIIKLEFLWEVGAQVY